VKFMVQEVIGYPGLGYLGRLGGLDLTIGSGHGAGRGMPWQAWQLVLIISHSAAALQSSRACKPALVCASC